MKKVLLTIICLFMLIPNIIFAIEKLEPPIIKSIEEFENNTLVFNIEYDDSIDEILLSTNEINIVIKASNDDINYVEQKVVDPQVIDNFKTINLSENYNKDDEKLTFKAILVDKSSNYFSSDDSNILKINEEYEEPEPKEENITLPLISDDKESIIDINDKCMFNINLCCKELNNISYCKLIIIGLIAILVLVILISIIIDKKEDKKYKDF